MYDLDVLALTDGRASHLMQNSSYLVIPIMWAELFDNCLLRARIVS